MLRNVVITTRSSLSLLTKPSVIRPVLKPQQYLSFSKAKLSTAATSSSSTTSLAKISSLPLISSKSLNAAAPVGKWLVFTSGFIALIVSVGGITRLTKSGLSMTTWKPQQGLPPMNVEEWEEEFAIYKQSPEYSQRKSMDLEEFKFIYFWEWGHRTLGRTAGVIFTLPMLYFTARKMVPAGYYPRLITLLCMGGTQGLIGWWMVKSGLGDDRRDDKKEIRVSPYRLATHLSTAFATYSVCLWTGLDLLHPREAMVKAGEQLANICAKNKPILNKLKTLRVSAIATTSLIAVTAASGAFVAGNDAGNAYNDWPYMNGQWIPEDIIDNKLKPLYRNIFEHTALVQFDHRMLAYTTSGAVTGLILYSRQLLNAGVITPQVQRALMLTGGVAAVQVTLGISTLMLYVPIALAATHQLGSLALLSSGIYLVHSLRYVGVAALRSGGGEKAASFAKVISKNSYKPMKKR